MKIDTTQIQFWQEMNCFNNYSNWNMAQHRYLLSLFAEQVAFTLVDRLISANEAMPFADALSPKLKTMSNLAVGKYKTYFSAKIALIALTEVSLPPLLQALSEQITVLERLYLTQNNRRVDLVEQAELDTTLLALIGCL